jgi:hypothetical protein
MSGFAASTRPVKSRPAAGPGGSRADPPRADSRVPMMRAGDRNNVPSASRPLSCPPPFLESSNDVPNRPPPVSPTLATSRDPRGIGRLGMRRRRQPHRGGSPAAGSPALSPHGCIDFGHASRRRHRGGPDVEPDCRGAGCGWDGAHDLVQLELHQPRGGDGLGSGSDRGTDGGNHDGPGFLGGGVRFGGVDRCTDGPDGPRGRGPGCVGASSHGRSDRDPRWARRYRGRRGPAVRSRSGRHAR